MGGLFGKPAPAPRPAPPPTFIDYSRAKFEAADVEAIQKKAQQALIEAQKTAAEQAKNLAAAGTWAFGGFKFWGWTIFTIIIMVGLGLLGAVIHDWIVGPTGARIILPITPVSPVVVQGLYISSAKYGVGSNTTDVSAYLSGQIQNGTTLPGFIVGPSTVGLQSDPVPNAKNTLYVTWYVGNGDYQQTTVNEGDQFPTLPTSTSTPASSSYSIFSSGSSGSLIQPQDASTGSSVPASKAPISKEGDGAYSMQWWMYVKDWNYGFGKKKAIIKRADPTNPSVLNPSVSLHPTDNSLQVSVSVFPSSEGSTGKTEPAPAGHSGATDDVFVCEVPNIPLQTWFSVSVSVFGRNLDIYVDGKLVKSCFLPGVPKPAVGDIQVTPEGGFSGQVCDLTHYPRMLAPADALNFWSSGSSCQSSGAGSVAPSKSSGYAVKFGVYDSTGKEVQEYAF